MPSKMCQLLPREFFQISRNGNIATAGFLNFPEIAPFCGWPHGFREPMLDRSRIAIHEENMRASAIVGTLFVVGIFSMSAAHADCTGTNGRGWGSGKGAGKFTMTQADGNCRISFPGFIDGKTRIPATNVTFTRQPKSGKITIQGGGMLYTPNKGFKGNDRFCTKNRSPKKPGQILSGCVTVTVR